MIKQVNWLEVKVTDVSKSLAFYRDVLGIRVKKEWPNYAIFDFPGTLTFAIMPGGRKGQKEGAPNIHFAVEDLDAEYEKLKKKGVEFIESPKKQYWGGYAALFTDPDGNLFYLTQSEN